MSTHTSGRRIVAVAAAACTAMSLSACGSSGTPSSGTDGSGLVRTVMNVKITGHTFFEEIRDGAMAAAPAAKVSLDYNGPTFSDGQQQATQLNSILQQGYKVLLLSANSPTVEAPAAKKAMAMGMPVITFDADVVPEARDLYVNDVNTDAFGKCLIDQAVKFAGPNAEVGYVSSNPDSPNQIAWIDAAEKYRQANYPNLKVDGTVYGKGDEGLSLTAAQDLIHANPNLKVLITPDSGAAPGAAEAITKLGVIGQVMSIGQGDLASSRKYVENGSEISCMWDNAGLGKLLVYLAKHAASNKLPANGTFTDDPDGTWKIQNSVIDFASEPTVFTKENVADYTDAGAKKN